LDDGELEGYGIDNAQLSRDGLSVVEAEYERFLDVGKTAKGNELVDRKPELQRTIVLVRNDPNGCKTTPRSAVTQINGQNEI
jgi:hypothetical protein